jgi:hypothetical protein
MATLTGSLGPAGAGMQVSAFHQSVFASWPQVTDTITASPDAGPTTADGGGNWSLTVTTAEPYYLRFVSGGTTVGWELMVPPGSSPSVVLATGSSVSISGTPAFTVSGTPAVTISGTPNVSVTSLPAAGTYPNPPGDVLAPAALQGVVVTANGSLGSDIDVSKYTEIDVFINCTAVAGTSPTVVLNVDVKAPDGTSTYASVYASSAVTSTGLSTQSIGRGCQTNKGFGNTIRIRAASFGGSSTPSLTFDITIVGKYG